MSKQRCAECGCWIYEQIDDILVCSECGKPCFVTEAPEAPEEVEFDA